MDKKTQIENATNAIKGSLDTINEARASLNRPPVPGGDSIWMQQQNFSLQALVARDKAGPPSAMTPAAAPPEPPKPAAKSFEDLSDDAIEREVAMQLKDLLAA